MPVTTESSTSYRPGPPIRPARILLDWLNGHGRSVQGNLVPLRIPVVVRFADANRLSIRDAFIGAPGSRPGEDTIFLFLDDTGLGISLLSRLQSLFPGGVTSCAVWLEGHWGRLVDLPGEPEPADVALGSDRRWPFAVLAPPEIVQSPSPPEQELTIFVGEPGR